MAAEGIGDMTNAIDPAVANMVKRLKRIVADAERRGVALVADADCQAIRVMLAAEEKSAEDLRGAGVTVSVHGGCGGAVLPRIDGSGNG